MLLRKLRVVYNLGLILCNCGCKEFFEEFDSRGRSRKYIKNHFKRGKNSQEHNDKISKSHKGIPLSEEHKEALRVPKSTTEKMSESHKGQIPWNKGLSGCFSKETLKKMSDSQKKLWEDEEYRKRMSESHIGKFPSNETRQKMSESHTRENHWNWKGGITELYTQVRNCPKMKEWCSIIKDWDNYTCQHCGQKHGDIITHHIIPFSQLMEESKVTTLEEALIYEPLWDVGNGITYCEKCHELLKNSGGILNDRT